MGIKISALPAIATPALTDIFPVVQGGVTYKETCTQLAALLGTVSTISITGTANQIIADQPTGNVTLSTPQDIATTSNVTFGSVAFSPTTKGIVGTPTNNDAGAGFVGEYITATGTNVSISSGVGKTITSISLTAGDWDVSGAISFDPDDTTTVAILSGSVSSTNNTNEVNTSLFFIQSTFTTGGSQLFSTGPTRKSLSGTTTIYFTTFTSFAVSTMTASATIAARRIR